MVLYTFHSIDPCHPSPIDQARALPQDPPLKEACCSPRSPRLCCQGIDIWTMTVPFFLSSIFNDNACARKKLYIVQANDCIIRSFRTKSWLWGVLDPSDIFVWFNLSKKRDGTILCRFETWFLHRFLIHLVKADDLSLSTNWSKRKNATHPFCSLYNDFPG